MKPGTITHPDEAADKYWTFNEATDKYWTVYGEYRDEEFPDGGVLEGDFVGVFCAATAEEARSLAHEYQPWLLNDSMIVEPGAAKDAYLLFPDSQRGPQAEEPDRV